MNAATQETVFDRLFAPLLSALDRAKHRRQCRGYSDRDYLVCGVRRIIAQVESGRGWVQDVREKMQVGVTVTSFFKSLRSARRLSLIEEVARDVVAQVDMDCGEAHDPLAEHEELNDFHVYASDGHYEKAACHARKVQGKVYAPGYFFSINLRSHSMSLLDIARPVKKKEHDMHALKRLTPAQLRLGAAKGVKVVHVYDPAGIDYRQWYNWKTQGIYVISREKENSKADRCGYRDFDRNDERNTGVLSDEYIGVSSGVMIRRVRYRDPATGTEFSFITNEMTLPPGLIAFLYKLRWDVEKVFDEKKNKLGERKAWATTEVARCQQAHFLCLAHNLLLLLERRLEREEGITDEKVEAKRRKRIEEMEQRVKASGLLPNPMVVKCTRITQRSLQFIRWLRNALDAASPWARAVEILRPLMANYLA